MLVGINSVEKLEHVEMGILNGSTLITVSRDTNQLDIR